MKRETAGFKIYGTEVIDELVAEVFTRNGEWSVVGVRLWYRSGQSVRVAYYFKNLTG